MKLTNEGIAVIEGDNYLSQHIIDQKRLDVGAEFLEQFRQYIPKRGVVVDVGASLGDYTVTFAEMVGRGGRVYAFEPNPPTYECLLYNTINLASIICFPTGLGAEVSRANVIQDHHNIGASRLTLIDSGAIHVSTLDSWFALGYSKRLDFLKIDAEGFEPLVLDGAKITIAECRPVMLIEVNTWPLGKMEFTAEDVFSRLDALNYQFDRFDGPYGDILCLPKERA